MLLLIVHQLVIKIFQGTHLGDYLKPNKDQWVFDVVYTPAKTQFIKKAEKVGAKIISGIDLFIFQALDAFILFNNEKVNQKRNFRAYKLFKTTLF